MTFPTAAAMTTRRSSFRGRLGAGISRPPLICFGAREKSAPPPTPAHLTAFSDRVYGEGRGDGSKRSSSSSCLRVPRPAVADHGLWMLGTIDSGSRELAEYSLAWLKARGL